MARVQGKMYAVIMIRIEIIPKRRERMDFPNRCARGGVNKLVVVVLVRPIVLLGIDVVVDGIGLIMTSSTFF
jgi:hypothetical protein